jgi:hypothetical protein
MTLRSYVTWQDFTSTWFPHLLPSELFVQLNFRNRNRNFGIFLWGWTVSPARKDLYSPNTFGVTKSRKIKEDGMKEWSAYGESETVEQCLYWEADSFWVSQGIFRSLWNPKFHFAVQESQPLILFFGPNKCIIHFSSLFSRCPFLILFPHKRPCFPSGLFTFRVSNDFCVHFPSLIHATRRWKVHTQ